MKSVKISTDGGSIHVYPEDVELVPGEEIEFIGTTEFSLWFKKTALKGKKKKEWLASSGMKLQGEAKNIFWFWKKVKYNVRVDGYDDYDPRVIIRRPTFQLLEAIIIFVIGFAAGIGGASWFWNLS